MSIPVPAYNRIPRNIASEVSYDKWAVYRIWRDPRFDRFKGSTVKPWMAVSPGRMYSKPFHTYAEAIAWAEAQAAKPLEATA